MRGIGKIGIIILGLLIIVSCKKEKIELQDSNEPVFTLNGNFNGEEVSYIAGDDGAYMNTYTSIVNGVNLYSGTIGTANSSVSIGIYNGNLDFNQVVLQDVIGSIAPLLAQQNQVFFEIHASDFLNLSYVQDVEWIVDGVNTGSDELAITEAGKYQVCAVITYNDLTIDTLCNQLIIGYAVHAESNVLINTQSGNVTASVTPLIGDISDVFWYIDDNFVGNGLYFYQSVGNNTRELHCKISYTNGLVQDKYMLVNGSSPGKNAGDFSVLQSLFATNYKQDYKLLVSLLKNGVEYRSDLIPNNSAQILLDNISYFGKNSNGKEVYKADISMSIELGTVGSSNTYPFEFQTSFGFEIE